MFSGLSPKLWSDRVDGEVVILLSVQEVTCIGPQSELLCFFCHARGRTHFILFFRFNVPFLMDNSSIDQKLAGCKTMFYIISHHQPLKKTLQNFLWALRLWQIFPLVPKTCWLTIHIVNQWCWWCWTKRSSCTHRHSLVHVYDIENMWHIYKMCIHMEFVFYVVALWVI